MMNRLNAIENPAATETLGATATASRTKTILVVEDEELVRQGIVIALRRAGHTVLCAADGVEGAMVFAHNFDTIDLLLTDAVMPGMDGIDLARFARSIRVDLKIIVASAHATTSSYRGMESALCDLDLNNALGIDGAIFLNKPFTVEELNMTVNGAIGRPFKLTLRAYSPSMSVGQM